MGKRVDVIAVIDHVLFVIEFKAVNVISLAGATFHEHIFRSTVANAGRPTYAFARTVNQASERY